MARTDPAKDMVFRVTTRLHRAILGASGGRLLNSFSGMPILQLRTVGRRSGRERVTMLAAPVATDDRVVLVASKGGDDRHPAWYLNLRANPDVEVVMKGEVREMRARVATEAEREELWPKVVAAYKGYGGYQRRTDRLIPVVICEPRQGAGD